MIHRKMLAAAFFFFSSSSSPTLRLIRVGDVLRRTRAFTSVDVDGYSNLSFDSNPIHFDPNIAGRFGFQDRVVHGMLVASLFPSIIASHFPGALYVSQSLRFKAPAYVGEELIAEVQALHLRENKSRYLVKFSTKCLKPGNALVIEGQAVALLPTLEISSV